MKNENLQWHPAFVAALRITFLEDMDYLQILEEYSLSKSPPRIDALILKKSPGIMIKKKIGQIFRRYNIIEYKSPEDNLSVNDFYKVYGYTCFYQSNTEKIKEIDPTELTITFVSNHYPREMFRHLEEVRKLAIEDQGNGIYYLTGDPIPMQFIHIPKLSKEENYWLQVLRNDLKAGREIRSLMENYEKNRKSKDCTAVMNLVTRVNWKQMEVEKKMCEALNELFAEELKEADLRGKAEGHKEGIRLAKQVFRLFSGGESIDDIARKCDISVEEVREILE